MSRIYKGGSSDRSYQGRKSNLARQADSVADRQRAIQAEGEKLLQDLATRDRERNRQNELTDQYTRAKEKAELSNLELLQLEEKGKFELSQKIQGFTTQNEQLLQKQSLEFEALTSGFQLKNNQLTGKNLFDNKQLVKQGNFQNSQLASRQLLEQRFLGENLSLKEQDVAEKLALGIEARGLAAQQNLDAAKQRADDANLQAQTKMDQAGVTALLGFAEIATDGAEIYGEYRKVEDAKQELIDSEASLWSTEVEVVDPNGDVNPAITNNQVATAEAVATESVVVSTTASAEEAEAVRQPSADAQASRNTTQATLTDAAGRANGEMMNKYYDPEFKIRMDDGRLLSGTEITTTAELDEFLQKLSAYYFRSSGVNTEDRYAVVTQLAPSIKKAVGTIRGYEAPLIINATQDVRKDAARDNAVAIIKNDGSLQEAVTVIQDGYYTSGSYRGDRGKANEDALRDLLPYLSDQQIEQLLETYKIVDPVNGPQKGTQFKDDPPMRKIIEQELQDRSNADYDADTRRAREATRAVTDANRTYVAALIEAGTDDEAVRAANETYRETLQTQNTPEALSLLLDLDKKQKGLNYSPIYSADFRDRIATGDYPTLEELSGALETGRITPSQYSELVKQMGTNGQSENVVEDVLGEAGVTALNQSISGQVVSALRAQFGNDAGLARAASRSIVLDAERRLSIDLRNHIATFEAANGRKPTSGELTDWAQQWIGTFIETRIKAKTVDGLNGGVEVTDGGVITGYDYLGESNPTPNMTTITTTDNAGEPVSYVIASDLTPSQLAENRTTLNINKDIILTEQDIADNVKQMQSGNWTPALVAKARALGVEPATLLRSQGQVLGYGDLGTVPPRIPTPSKPEDTPAVNQQVVYRSGNVGPTSTGPHLDVKRVDGGRFEDDALNDYVVVRDPEFGDVTLGEIRDRTGGVGDNWDQHAARGSHGIDYGLHSNTEIRLINGAKVVSSTPTAHGDYLIIQLPNGDQYSFLHGETNQNAVLDHQRIATNPNASPRQLRRVGILIG